jgi:hypothetical protein
MGLVALSFLSSCGHLQKNPSSFYTKICTSPEAVSDGEYDVEFDVVSGNHGSAIYFTPCPNEYFRVDLSIVMPRDQLDSDFAQAIYRNSEDPYSVLRIDGKVDYKFLKKNDFLGGEFTILSMDNWAKAEMLLPNKD